MSYICVIALIFPHVGICWTRIRFQNSSKKTVRNPLKMVKLVWYIEGSTSNGTVLGMQFFK